MLEKQPLNPSKSWSSIFQGAKNQCLSFEEEKKLTPFSRAKLFIDKIMRNSFFFKD